MMSTQNRLMSRRGCKSACCPRCCSTIFAALIHVVLVRFSENEDIVRDLVRLEESMGGKEVPLPRVQRAVWGMLYADAAGIVTESAEGFLK